MSITIGIGEMAVSADPEQEIRTFALGSCVAVIAYDPEFKIAGMVHIALPATHQLTGNCRRQPGYFADTAIPELIKQMQRTGAHPKNLWIKLAGGAKVLDNMNQFDIGKKNILAVTRILWSMRLPVIRKDLGGNISRTVTLRTIDGKIYIRNKDKKWDL